MPPQRSNTYFNFKMKDKTSDDYGNGSGFEGSSLVRLRTENMKETIDRHKPKTSNDYGQFYQRPDIAPYGPFRYRPAGMLLTGTTSVPESSGKTEPRVGTQTDESRRVTRFSSPIVSTSHGLPPISSPNKAALADTTNRYGSQTQGDRLSAALKLPDSQTRGDRLSACAALKLPDIESVDLRLNFFNSPSLTFQALPKHTLNGFH